MRRQFVPLRLIVAACVMTLSLTGCGIAKGAMSSSGSSSIPQPAATTATGSSKPAAKPAANQGEACNENTVPAFQPDFSKSSPLPGGGRTSEELWNKALKLIVYGHHPERVIYDPFDEYSMGLPHGIAPEQAGVICPISGNVYITGQPEPVLTNAQFVNKNPKGGYLLYPGGRLYVHSAKDALGNQPCLAIVEIDENQNGMSREKAVETYNVYVGCTNNGSFWAHSAGPQTGGE